MSRRLHPYSLGVTAAAACAQSWITPLVKGDSQDPHEPRPRSKGQKARNKKYRR